MRLCVCLRCGQSGLECDPDQICEHCRTDIDRERMQEVIRNNAVTQSGNCVACGKDEAARAQCWCVSLSSEKISESPEPPPPPGAVWPTCLVSVSNNREGYWVWRQRGTTLERLLPDGTWENVKLETNYPPTMVKLDIPNLPTRGK